MKWIFFLTFSFSLYFINGQKNQIDHLELLFDQGHYKMVYKKSSRFLKKEQFSSNYSVLFFNSISEFMLSENNNKFSLERSVENYKKVCFSDADYHIRGIYYNYIHDFKNEMISRVIDLKQRGKKKKGKQLVSTYNEIFKDQPIVYNDLTLIENKEDQSTINVSSKSESTELLDYAKKYLGVPYVYGGTSKKGFDCSGYTQHVYAHHGSSIPRTAQNQSQYVKKIKLKNVKTGDLLFYGKNKNKITHVGIAINNKGEDLKMIHASSSKGISITNVINNSYWEPKIQFAGRVTN